MEIQPGPAGGRTAKEAYELAKDAHWKIDGHEKLCAERYKHILEGQTAAALSQSQLQSKMDKWFDAQQDWRRGLYSFFWKIVGGTILTLGGTCAALIVYIFKAGLQHALVP